MECSQGHCEGWESLRVRWKRGIRDKALQTNMMITHMVAKVSKCITSLAASLPFNIHNSSMGFLEVSGGLLAFFGI